MKRWLDCLRPVYNQSSHQTIFYMKYNCLIVDDEKLGSELIQSYIENLPQLQVVQACSAAMEAMQILAQQQVDILFLDINMPKISGIDFLKQQTNQPLTVLCTAHSESALESYDLDVVDYLLKPIDFVRFSKAIGKVMTRLGSKPIAIAPAVMKEQPSHFFVKSEYKKIKIEISKIDYIEAMEKYIRIWSGPEKVLTLMSMSQVLQLLPADQFIRIHRSYIINKEKIEQIEGNLLTVAGKPFPVSRGNRGKLSNIINS